jgi:hypothetical protein
MLLRSVVEMGWSVFPLKGKRPALPNTPQGQRPQYGEQRYHLYNAANWLTVATWLTQGYSAFGIAGGKASGGLVLLDFDGTNTFQQAAAVFPWLRDTWNVHTPRGMHVYLLTDSTPIKSQNVRFSSKHEGIELRGDGLYVVAPYSQVDGYTYNLTTTPDRLIRHVKPEEIEVLFQWAKQQAPKTSIRVPSNRPTLRSADNWRIEDVVTLFKQKTSEQGARWRGVNCALGILRNKGISSQQAAALLCEEYVAHPPLRTNHPPETPEQRRADFQRKLNYIYSSPARTDSSVSAMVRTISDDLARAMHRAKHETLYRVMNTILTVRGEIPHTATAPEILSWCKSYGVGREGIKKALLLAREILTTNAEDPPSDKRKTNYVGKIPPSNTASTDVEREKYAYKNTARGRPAEQHTLPTLEQLYIFYGVRPGGDSTVPPEVAAKRGKARKLLLVEFIALRNGQQISTRRIACEHGISLRYTRFLVARMPEIEREPVFDKQPLTFATIGRFVPDDENVQHGMWLTATCPATGRCMDMPPRRDIARRWLAWGYMVMFVRQCANRWWYRRDSVATAQPDAAVMPMLAGG